MKTPHLLRLSFILAALLGAAALPAADTDPRPIASGIVEYELSTNGMGSTTTGTRTEWFADHGRKVATLEKTTTQTEIFGQKNTERKEELTIIDGDTMYTIDLVKKTGSKGDIAEMKKMGAMMANRMAGPGGVQNGREFVEKNGGKWLPAETFLGRKCDVVEMMGVRTWTYQGVNLKTEGAMMGITTKQVAKQFEENVRVPAAKFEVPAGITIEEQQMPDEAAEFLRALGGGAGGKEAKEGGDDFLAQVMQRAQAESDADAEENDEDSGPPSTLPLAKFKAAVAKVQVAGCQRMPVISQDGDHGLILAGDEDQGWTIMAQRATIGEQFEAGAGAKAARFKHKGHDAFFARITDPEGEEMAFIVVKYPEYNMGLFITAKPATTRSELMKVLALVEL
jgi:hypothetical protein